MFQNNWLLLEIYALTLYYFSLTLMCFRASEINIFKLAQHINKQPKKCKCSRSHKLQRYFGSLLHENLLRLKKSYHSSYTLNKQETVASTRT